MSIHRAQRTSRQKVLPKPLLQRLRWALFQQLSKLPDKLLVVLRTCDQIGVKIKIGKPAAARTLEADLTLAELHPEIAFLPVSKGNCILWTFFPLVLLSAPVVVTDISAYRKRLQQLEQLLRIWLIRNPRIKVPHLGLAVPFHPFFRQHLSKRKDRQAVIQRPRTPIPKDASKIAFPFFTFSLLLFVAEFELFIVPGLGPLYNFFFFDSISILQATISVKVWVKRAS